MRLLILILLLILSNNLIGQKWSISFKTGAAKTLAAPVASKQSFAYKTISSSKILPTIGVELERRGRNNFIMGASLSPISKSFDFKNQNIDINQSFVPSLTMYDYDFQIYVGLEHRLRKTNSPAYKNYFSILGGIGLNYFYYNSGESGVITPSYGKTKDGRTLVGMDAGFSNNIFGALSIFGGVRYNITNSKGKQVAKIELMMNYGVIKYFNWKIKYELDGVQKVEYIPEHGLNVQLNLIVPIFNFSKPKPTK